MDSLEEKFASLLPFDEAESDEDRLKKCIEHLFEHPIFEDTRSTNNAVMFISMARTAISDKDYEAAIDFYTKGLQEVVPYCEFSAILYSGRAMALECLEMYEESLIDIDRAIEISPNTKLGEFFKDTKMELEKKASTSHTKPKNRNHFEDIPLLSHDENKSVPGMCDAVHMVHSAKYGVNFEATKPIGTGDVILIEKPQATSLLQSDVAVADACYYCLIRCKALLPCEQCNSALYCSKECRAKAYEEYHRIQCNSKNFPDDVQFVLNLLMKITENGEKLTEAIKYCEKLDTMSTDSKKEFCTKRDNLGNNLKSVLNLSISMKKNDKRNEKYILKSAHIASFLQDQTNYMQGYDDILGVAKLLFRLFYIFYAHGFTEFVHGDVEFHKTNKGIVYSLYSVLSLFHHSCCANTVYSIHKNGVIVVRAATDINRGEQITFNFLRTNKSITFPFEFMLQQVSLQEEGHIICDCFTSKLPCISELDRKLQTPKELKSYLRKKRLDSVWELATREVDRV